MSSSRLPELPPEILDLILAEAFPPPSTLTLNEFHRVRDMAEERALVDWAAEAGTVWLPFVRSLLFYAPHVGSRQRANKFLSSLRLPLPGQPDSKDYLARLISRLSLDIRERQLPPGINRIRKHGLEDGVTSKQVVELAQALPNLDSLVVDLPNEPGWLGDEAIIGAVQRFNKVRHLEMTSTGLGWQNALAVFVDFDRLESLKLRGLTTDWTILTELISSTASFTSSVHPPTPYAFAKNLTTLVLRECALSEVEFTKLCESLALPAPDNSDAPSTPSLRHLTIHHLQSYAAEDPLTSGYGDTSRALIPFSPRALTTSLAPLISALHSFHLILFDRPPITTNDIRTSLVLSGALKDGHTTRNVDPGSRPGNALVRLLGPEVESVTLGGPWCLSGGTNGGLWDALDLAQGRIRKLVLVQCADVERPGPGVRGIEGVGIEDFVEALGREWASRLECVDVRRMQADVRGDEENPAWDAEGLERLKEAVQRISDERVRTGAPPMRVLVDEELVERKRDERLWNERNRMKRRGGKRGRSGTAGADREAGLSNKKNKRTTTV
ncbi:Proteophosphoglycan 5 [Rhodotorula toruloides ATCC 204091]|uniref:Proteophosphoglycan 5 n=1 Tax=Rhodotorula toruloides TaxID=5286 RepID=A0A2T0A2K6_RHOTO|nr:Proteophosphoglycan 5 [Rhodotorula toruloides ATCC 204091]PRQ72247.1 Proteophosphoglycan 5 [Rhodotorula toruloides]